MQKSQGASSKMDKSEEEFDRDRVKNIMQGIIGGLDSIQFPNFLNGSSIDESENEEEKKSEIIELPSIKEEKSQSPVREKSISVEERDKTIEEIKVQPLD